MKGTKSQGMGGEMNSSKRGVPVLALILGGSVLGGVLAGVWVVGNIDANLFLRDQQATVRIPGVVPVTADILNNLDIELKGDITTTVPVDQMVTLPIRDTLNVMATVDHDIPIKMNVAIRDTIRLDQVIKVNSKVEVDVLGTTLRLPVRGDIPIKADVPVTMNVPVNQPVRMKFTAPVAVDMQQALPVPLRTNIATTIPISSRLDVPVRSALNANVTIPGPVDTVITKADLNLPLRTLGFSRNRDEQSAVEAGPSSGVAQAGTLPARTVAAEGAAQ